MVGVGVAEGIDVAFSGADVVAGEGVAVGLTKDTCSTAGVDWLPVQADSASMTPIITIKRGIFESPNGSSP